MEQEETIHLEFNLRKAVEILIYVSRRIEEPTILRVFKLVYLAEKLHLERYGLMLCNDRYDALQYGPAPRNMYDIVNEARYVDDYGFRVRERNIEVLREENREHLSEATIFCLDEVLKQFGDEPIGRLVEASHDRAWEEAWRERGEVRRFEMPLESIVDKLKDGAEILAYLRNEGL
ncbi:MAG: Panacea domain-containing protein [Anaerolineaceae bacterium]|nr:Panacea domain-containing protein [Anaerolineaceae bacterium]MCY3936565.1 Panacea domain-containing protein [Chloroflexota bacterium]MCY4009299.1 Panacea domain-containing protein [Anaerolineaceae bacterium]MCY4106361.1 Panacea domain-containing protein [Chloroflexota bacterium]